MQPQYPGEVAVNPFDFWNGRDFKIKICTIGEYPNYDKSEFSPASPFLGGDDKKLEALWHTQYPLLPFTAVSEFKSFDELQQIYNDVLQNGNVTTSIAEENRNVSSPRQTNHAPFAARPASTNPMHVPNTSSGSVLLVKQIMLRLLLVLYPQIQCTLLLQ